MQIIDELEVNKRGPYGGGLGHVSFSGTMDMALGLRTMVIPTANEDSLYSYSGTDSRREWTVHLQVCGYARRMWMCCDPRPAVRLGH
jgi:anthranilate synthase component 1